MKMVWFGQEFQVNRSIRDQIHQLGTAKRIRKEVKKEPHSPHQAAKAVEDTNHGGRTLRSRPRKPKNFHRKKEGRSAKNTAVTSRWGFGSKGHGN